MVDPAVDAIGTQAFGQRQDLLLVFRRVMAMADEDLFWLEHPQFGFFPESFVSFRGIRVVDIPKVAEI